MAAKITMCQILNTLLCKYSTSFKDQSLSSFIYNTVPNKQTEPINSNYSKLYYNWEGAKILILNSDEILTSDEKL